MYPARGIPEKRQCKGGQGVETIKERDRSRVIETEKEGFRAKGEEERERSREINMV